MVVRRGRRLFPVRVLKQCGILAAGNWDLDHGNRLAKSGSYTQRRLTHHLVFFFFVCPCFFAGRYRPQFLTYRNEIVQAHCPRGGISAFVKNLGVGPPWGKFFPQIFFQDIDLKICVCHARDPGTARLKNFHDRSHRGRTVAMNVRACRQGPRARQTPVTSAAAVHRYNMRTIDKRAGLLLVV